MHSQRSISTIHNSCLNKASSLLAHGHDCIATTDAPHLLLRGQYTLHRRHGKHRRLNNPTFNTTGVRCLALQRKSDKARGMHRSPAKMPCHLLMDSMSPSYGVILSVSGRSSGDPPAGHLGISRGGGLFRQIACINGLTPAVDLICKWTLS